MKLHLIVVFSSVLAITLGGEFSPRCKNPTPVKQLDESTEKECMGKWYGYALSNQCDNCCYIRTLEQVQPGEVKLIQLLKKPGDSSAARMEANVKKDPNAAIYKINGTNPVAILAVDCKNYLISYNMDRNTMAIFTRQPDPNPSLVASANKAASKCNMKLFKYNTKECSNI